MELKCQMSKIYIYIFLYKKVSLKEWSFPSKFTNFLIHSGNQHFRNCVPRH